jgi:serine/threonine protein kinase
VTLRSDTKLLQYRIVQVLGACGFGVTYLAKDEMLEKLFAIKEYFPEQFATRKGNSVRSQATKIEDFQWGLTRFLDEARSLARFHHPNIAGVNQIFEANNTAYIVLEYQDGRNLKAWAQEFAEGPGQEELDAIVPPLLDALALIHRNDLLHRDIAPDNIYIRRDGSPVILDFGSAREASAARSKTISAIVKAGYSPPEQYSTRGTGQGPWSDIYALAATLYFCVCGQQPEESTERLIGDQYEPAGKAAKRLYRSAFLDAIDWGLRLAPRERPQTVEEWRRSLVEGQPIAASSATLAPAVRPEARSATEPKPDDAAPNDAKSRRKKLAVAGVLVLVIAAAGIGVSQRERLFSSPSATHPPATSPAVRPDVAPPKVPAPSAPPSVPPESASNATRNMPIKTLCEKALNGSASGWDTADQFQPHVDEARRRGLSVADCRKIVADETSPSQPRTQPPVAPAPSPPQQIVLSLDSVIRKETNWTIGVNQSLDGCIASINYTDRTTLWFGYTGASNLAYLAFSNPKWTSLEVGALYNLVLDFGNTHTMAASFGGVRGAGEKGVFHSGLDKGFVDYVAGLDRIGLSLEGRQLTPMLPLPKFNDIRVELAACQQSYRRTAN